MFSIASRYPRPLALFLLALAIQYIDLIYLLKVEILHTNLTFTIHPAIHLTIVSAVAFNVTQG